MPIIRIGDGPVTFRALPRGVAAGGVRIVFSGRGLPTLNSRLFFSEKRTFFFLCDPPEHPPDEPGALPRADAPLVRGPGVTAAGIEPASGVCGKTSGCSSFVKRPLVCLEADGGPVSSLTSANRLASTTPGDSSGEAGANLLFPMPPPRLPSEAAADCKHRRTRCNRCSYGNAATRSTRDVFLPQQAIRALQRTEMDDLDVGSRILALRRTCLGSLTDCYCLSASRTRGSMFRTGLAKDTEKCPQTWASLSEPYRI